MKIAVIAAITFLIASSTFNAAMAQKKIKEGSVTYSLTYDLTPEQQQQGSSLPTEITCYFRGDSSAAIINQSVATVKGVSVIKSSYHSLIIDIPSASKKIAVVLTPTEVEEEKAALPQFKGIKGTEKQVINGYHCTKVPVSDTKSGATYEIWVTTDIDMPPNSVDVASNKFGGTPVKFVTYNGGYKINAVIKEIKEEAVPAGFFTAPKDYESMSYTQLKAM